MAIREPIRDVWGLLVVVNLPGSFVWVKVGSLHRGDCLGLLKGLWARYQAGLELNPIRTTWLFL